MSTSDGGGYCDCGDAEAWRFSPCCELHTPSNEEGRSADEVCHYLILTKFFDKSDADKVFQAVSSWAHSLNLPKRRVMSHLEYLAGS